MNGIKNKKIEYFSGTFDFCDGCPSNKNCCTGKTVDKAMLTLEDIHTISKRTGLKPAEFSVPSKRSLSYMKVRNSECYFYQNKKCVIYDVRPLDCRLFPFDIQRYKNQLVLVWYHTACPKRINAEAYEEKVESLLHNLYPYMAEFAELYSPLLDKHKYKIVKPVAKI